MEDRLELLIERNDHEEVIQLVLSLDLHNHPSTLTLMHIYRDKSKVRNVIDLDCDTPLKQKVLKYSEARNSKYARSGVFCNAYTFCCANSRLIEATAYFGDPRWEGYRWNENLDRELYPLSSGECFPESSHQELSEVISAVLSELDFHIADRDAKVKEKLKYTTFKDAVLTCKDPLF